MQKNKNKKEAFYNQNWTKEKNIKIKNQKYSIMELYEKVANRSKEIYAKISKVAEKEIPKDKYILFVNSVVNGISKSKNIKYIKKERLEKLFLAETGSKKIDLQNFQKKNITYVLGFKQNDKRLKEFKCSKDKNLPKDLKQNCIGVVFSGSEIFLFEETIPERIKTAEKARWVYSQIKDLDVPILGICFGGQLIAEMEGAKIDWVKNEKGEKERIEGTDEVLKTNIKTQYRIPKKIFVAENHGQEIKEETLPKNSKIIAKRVKGGVEMVEIENKTALQFHLEATETRVDIALNTANIFRDPTQIFGFDYQKAKELIVPTFLKKAGEYGRKIKSKR